ncbi:MAG TPA: hypothetical protein VJZ25_01150, partial [Gemmatimonadaceae bacterium]|nr:hypothetical protein [Gemmatimonadaceae bacterium]
ELHRINLWSRVANRVLVRVDEFHSSTFHELERRAKKVEWSRFLAPGQPVRFRVTCRKSKLYHSDAVAERLLRATGAKAADAARANGVDTTEGDDEEPASDAQLFVARIANDICTISADSSGELLHRRGYRQAIAKAPLRETLAAAMLLGCEWDPATPLVDPMCGSGTIAIEGAMIARNLPPGIERRFAFERWPSHDAAAWRRTLDEARAHALPKAPARIVASDRDAGAVKATRENAERSGVLGDIEISERPVSAADYPDTPGWIVTNPPYGLRVGESAPLRNLYAQLGNIARERAEEYRIAILSADAALESQLRLDLHEVFRTTNGGIPVRLVAGGA